MKVTFTRGIKDVMLDAIKTCTQKNEASLYIFRKGIGAKVQYHNFKPFLNFFCKLSFKK